MQLVGENGENEVGASITVIGFYLCYYLSTNINAKILLGQAQARPSQAHNITISICEFT